MPDDEAVLRSIIQTARKSFTGKLDVFQRHYLFVLEGIRSKRLAGTSMIYSQHGQPDTPHVFFDVIDDERYSVTLDRHFSHVTLRLGFNYRGPTEIGALVLDPAFRSMGLGKALSFIRFLFVAMYRERFQSFIIAELMPPLESDGRSLLWEHLGRHFTGLSYQEADKLSHANKEFIYALFPQSPLYASLLPPEVRGLIGQVGEDTKPVRTMLESIGFEYSRRIDPFDGGPHFHARVNDILPIREARRLRLSTREVSTEEEQAVLGHGGRPAGAGEMGAQRRLMATGQPEGPTQFRATLGAAFVEGGSLMTSKDTRRILGLRAGDDVWCTVI